MKKQLCVMAAACGLLSLASCSDDENVIIDQPVVEAGEQVITLDVQNTDVLATKSRPLYSTDPKGAELVTHVKLYIFEMQDQATTQAPMKLHKVIDIPNWNNASTDYSYGRKYTYKLTGEYKLEKDKTYTIIAVGQDEESTNPAPFTFNNGKALSALVEGTDYDEDDTWSATTTPGTGFIKTDAVTYNTISGCANNEKVVSEIFSGTSKPVELSLDGGFQATVLLKRQVAGVIGYFNRIPAWVPVEDYNGTGELRHASTAAIRLVSSARNANVDLAIQLSKQNDDAQNNEADIENIVNGYSESTQTADAQFKSGADAYTIYQIDLTKWFAGAQVSGSYDGTNRLWNDDSMTSEVTDNGAKLLNEAVWLNALKGTNNTPIVADGAVLAGEFVIPFDRVTGIKDNTFELQLVDSTGYVTKAWNVKLDDKSLNPELGDDSYVYNVYRNHLYQIGMRGAGDDPNKPGEEPDKPQPLDKDQELLIKINDNWEWIHDMEIE